MSRLGQRLGFAGGILGVVAGAVQWAFGSDIPEWTGNKLHTVQLGIITVALSLMALAALRHAARHPGAPPRLRLVLALGVLAPAGICFTTVGRLWYVPGLLLALAAALLFLPPTAAVSRPRPPGSWP